MTSPVTQEVSTGPVDQDEITSPGVNFGWGGGRGTQLRRLDTMLETAALMVTAICLPTEAVEPTPAITRRERALMVCMSPEEPTEARRVERTCRARTRAEELLDERNFPT